MGKVISIEGIDQYGVIVDRTPFTLPLNAMSFAHNVRFDQGAVRRMPVAKTAFEDLAATPVWAMGVSPPEGVDRLIYTDINGRIYEFSSTSEVDVTDSGYSEKTSPDPFTGTVLANIEYVNRKDHPPRKRGTTDAKFVDLPNWPTDLKAKVFRSYSAFAVAMNLYDGTTERPNTVKVSDITLANSVPQSWDHTDPTTSALENTLVQMRDGIEDGLPLNNDFLIYGQTETWKMSHVGGRFIMRFSQLFGDAGVLSTNCVLEHDRKHYVFGQDDIWVTDGTSKQSVADGRVRQWVFNNMNMDFRSEAFVTKDPQLDLIWFCFPSNDERQNTDGYPNVDHCNRAAVYNPGNDTWTLVTLPNVTAAGVSTLSVQSSYDTINTSFSDIGQRYAEVGATTDKSLALFSVKDTNAGLSKDRIFAMDQPDFGILSNPISEEGTRPAFIERVGIDLRKVSNIRDYGVIRIIYPLFMSLKGVTNTIRFGASNTPTQIPTWQETHTFNPETQYKVDTIVPGRFFSVHFGTYEPHDFELSGFDLDIARTGRR